MAYRGASNNEMMEPRLFTGPDICLAWRRPSDKKRSQAGFFTMNTDAQEVSKPGSDHKDMVLELNFVPTWAREPPGRNPYADYEDRRERTRRTEPRPRGAGRPMGRKTRGREARAMREVAPREEPRRDKPPSPAVLVQVSFVPERNRLGALVRDLRASGRAYPLADLAVRFLSSPAFYLVKLESEKFATGQPPRLLHQCKICQLVFGDERGLADHALKTHFDHMFVRETRSVDPPSGQFTCVARCRLSGELLPPPNYHGYNEKVLALWRTRFPHMTLDDYRAHIEIIREPEMLEQWKRLQSTRVVFRRKDQPEAPALEEDDARQLFRECYYPEMALCGHRFILPAETAQKLEDEALRRAVRGAWARESRRPYSLMMALRPAFHHMHLYLFKTPGGVTFVTAIQPHPLDPRRAVKNIAEVLHYLRRHPGCTRQELVQKLRPGMAADSPQAAAVLGPLRWLIERGHIIEFFNGTLSVPGAEGAARPAAPTAAQMEPVPVAAERPATSPHD